MIWTHHVVGEQDGLVQCCVICGEEICNYENASVPIGQSLPFWNPGDIYIGGKNPTVFVTTRPEEEDDIVKNCEP